MLNSKLTITALALSLLANTAIAQNQRFIDRKSEGWWWYQVEPEIELVEQTEEQPVPAPNVQPEQTTPTAAASKAPEPFSAAWFRENLDKYKDAAWDNPTVENMEAYLYMQRFVLDRSEEFADVAVMTVTGNPLLDEMTRRPTATYAAHQVDSLASKEHDRLVTKLAETAGIFYFYDAEDEYSVAMAPLVQLLKRSGFAIVAISGDGEPIPGFESEFEYQQDQGHALQLGVSTVPALFLASPEGEFAAVGHGMMSLPDMTNRMLVVAKREGWISEDEYNKTRPVTNYDSLPRLLANQSKQNGIQAQFDPENGNYVTPEQLLKFIKSNTRGF